MDAMLFAQFKERMVLVVVGLEVVAVCAEVIVLALGIGGCCVESAAI